jgi:tetratricopeptide (TPR) repeat protein
MRLALAILCLLVAGSALAGPLQDLERAQRNFKSKDCQSAVPILKDLLYPEPQLSRTSELCEAHTLLGVCHYEGGRRDDAKAEFEKCLAIDPSKTLEPLIFSEGQVRLFDETRADVEARAKRDRELRELEERNERIRRLLENTRNFESRSWAVNFAPFGAGQFQNGHRTKGILVATGQGLTAVTSLGIFLYLAGTYGLEAKVPIEDAASVRRLQQIEVVSGAAFFAIYGYSIIDGILNFKPRVQIEVDPALQKELEKTAPKPTKTTSRLHFGPMLLPGGAGVGLVLEND